MKLVSINIRTLWHADKSNTSMVSEVEEDLGVLIGLEHGLASGVITFENLHQVFSSSRRTCVINLATLIHVLAWSSSSCWLVENLPWEGV